MPVPVAADRDLDGLIPLQLAVQRRPSQPLGDYQLERTEEET